MTNTDWIIPTMLAVIGFCLTYGVKVMVDRLTVITEKLSALQNLFTAHDKDISHLQHHVDRIDKEMDAMGDRVRDLENHSQRHHNHSR